MYSMRGSLSICVENVATSAVAGAFTSVAPISGNAITSVADIARIKAHTNCDGVMIGRGAQGRPWVFREFAHFLATGEHLPDMRPHEVCAILVEHLENLYAFYGEAQGVRIARKHLGWYAKDRPENASFRAVVNRAESASEQLRLTGEYFAALQQARAA